jgi:hypothetical protein
MSGRSVVRKFAGVLAATALALGIAAVQAQPVAAMSSARTLLAANLNELTISCNVYAQHQVWGTLLKQFSAVGVSTSGWYSPDDIANSSSKINDVTVSEADGGPAPGDVAVFTPELGYASSDMAIFVTNGDVVVWDPITGHFENVPRAALDGASTKSSTLPFARKGSVTVYRIPSSRWPGGHDDTSVAPGHIELVDPHVMTKQINWALSHPRDPDQSFWHQLWTGATSVLAWISGAIGAGVNFLLGAGSWLLHHSWIFGGAVLAVLGVLSKHFDASFFNHLITSVLFAPVLGTLTLLRMAAGALGLSGLASWLGGTRTFLFNAYSLFVAVATGLQGEGESSIGGVLLAALSDWFLVLKPLGAGAKVGELFGLAGSKFASVAAFGDRLAALRTMVPVSSVMERLGMVTEWGKAAILGRNGLVVWVSKTNDFITLRPSIFLRGFQIAVKSSANRVADIVSWIWRPQSVVSESSEHLQALVSGVERNVIGAKEFAEKFAPAAETTGKLVQGWSAGSHLTYVATTGHVQTVQPPHSLRPSELLRLHLSAANHPAN